MRLENIFRKIFSKQSAFKRNAYASVYYTAEASRIKSVVPTENIFSGTLEKIIILSLKGF